MSKRVAVIDIGSNSIKALVAESDGSQFGIGTVFSRSLPVRISKGISGDPPVLNEAIMQLGVDAVDQLGEECLAYEGVSKVQIVATSAVRSAENGGDFMDMVHRRTGINPTILSGRMEAEAIGYGVRTDPAIRDNLQSFTVFDLGGGSLELIRFENNQVESCVSLPLGSVLLTEQFITNPHSPVLRDRANMIIMHIQNSIEYADFEMSQPLIGCSGGLATWRSIRAKREGVGLMESSPVFTMDEVERMVNNVAYKTLRHRITIAQIPLERADIFPVALLTFKSLMEMCGVSEITHSMHNLSYGIAWELLRS